MSYLEGQPEGLVGGPAGRHDGVEGLEQGHAAGLALLPLDGPTLGGGKGEYFIPTISSRLNEADISA